MSTILKLFSQEKPEVLKEVVDSLIDLENEKAAISKKITEMKKKAMSHGIDIQALKTVISLKKLNSQERVQFNLFVEEYKQILGI